VTSDRGRLPGGIDGQVNWISESGVMPGVCDNGQPDPLSGVFAAVDSWASLGGREQ